MPRPEDAQRTHAVDQLGSVARDLAHPVAQFYAGLLAEGVAPADAQALAGQFIRQLLQDLRR